MKVVQINATCGTGSTGKICTAVSDLLTKNNIANHIFYSSGNSSYTNATKYMSAFEVKLGALESRVFGNSGFESAWETRRLMRYLDRFEPDIVHLHNIHAHNCDLELLFERIRNKKIIWTFHDCWAFTGTCAHFMFSKCEKWKSSCKNCPRAREFSWFADKTSRIYARKKELFADIDMTIVTPSKWLADLVSESFLGKNKIEIINNGINLGIFKPTPGSFREKYGIKDSDKVILGVAYNWGERKGLDVFIRLSELLPDHFRIVLVGTDKEVDGKIPSGIISIHRTQNQQELAALYTEADVFLNPTREDTYPTVNMESIACGTPVVTFRVGGSPEMITEKTGVAVEAENIDGLLEAIKYTTDKEVNADMKESCLAVREAFGDSRCFQKYLDLYKRVYV